MDDGFAYLRINILAVFARDFYGGVASTIMLGFSLAGLLMLPDLLIADVTDDDELKTGVRREGMFFGMNGFIIRFAFSLQGILTGSVLTLSGYIPPSNGNLYPSEPLSAIWGIRIMIAALAALVTFLLLRKYALHGDRLDRVRTQVRELHQQKAMRVQS